jgi:hypothetical protein
MALQVRIDRENHKRLARAARDSRRSLVQEANKIIADHFAPKPELQPASRPEGRETTKQ